MTTPKTIKAEYERAIAAEAELARQIAALQAPAPIPPGSTIVAPGADVRALATSGKRSFVFRGDASTPHRFAFGPVPTTFADLSFLPYPGDSPVIDGAGLDQHLLYLDVASGTARLGVAFRNFRPVDGAVVGVGNGCRLETIEGFGGVGAGPAGPWPATSGPQNSHAVYFHGTGTGHLVKPNLVNFPGAAITSWRGSPIVVIEGGKLGSHYVSLLGGAGRITAKAVDFVRADGSPAGPLPKIDVQQYRGSPGEPDADPTATVILDLLCTGTGPGASVRRAG